MSHWYYYEIDVRPLQLMQIAHLPANIQPTYTLHQIVTSLPTLYQHVLGNIDYPKDDGESLAHTIKKAR